MQYKTCKHEQNRSCRECQCHAWCNQILTCACGCHDKPTYSFTDYMDAQFAADEASTSLKVVAAQQAKERQEIEARLPKLNAEIVPFAEKGAATLAKLNDLKNRLLGPWEDRHTYGSSSSIYILNATTEIRNGVSEKVWYHNRVWLRVVKRDHRTPDWQWEVQVRGLDPREQGLDQVLGPPSPHILRKNELQMMKAKAEPYIIKMGYILPIKGA